MLADTPSTGVAEFAAYPKVDALNFAAVGNARPFGLLTLKRR
jgi:hypothetical protein